MLNDIAFTQMKPNRDKALMLAQRELASLVHNAVELEGIHFTLPEIQTLLDGMLDAGYPAINLPAKHQLEFNQLMLDFYSSGNETPMNRFLRSCLDERIIKIMAE